MSLKQDLQTMHNRLDKAKRKLDAARGRNDNQMITRFTDEIANLEKQLASLKGKKQYEDSKEKKRLQDMPFSREITKAEQADIGKLKKKVRGLEIVHPLTKLGKELRLDTMTGFAPKEF
jgi:hypothetical protein